MQAPNKEAGSYPYGSFDENEVELDRLNLQARVAVALERSMWRKLGIRKGTHAIDLACGSGMVSIELAKFLAPGTVVGIDIADDLLAEAERNKNESKTGNVVFRKGDIYALHDEQDKFDFAYARFIFQHLEDPRKAAQGVFHVLNPGGVICAVDVDDAWLSMYPCSEAFEYFKATAAEGQQDKGGDRFVGRKLGCYLQESGFSNVHTDIRVITSQDIDMQTLLDITTGFKVELVPEREKARCLKILEQIYARARDERAWLGVGVFVVSGRRD